MSGSALVLKSLKHAARGFADRRALAELRPLLEATVAARRPLSGLDDTALEARVRAGRGRPPDETSFAECCAVAAEIATRTLALDPRPEQILAAAALHRGGVAELPTGEVKTLAAALSAFVAVSTGRAVHVIPPNDYLAARDAEEMGPLFRFAGFSVGTARPGVAPFEKRRTYRCDVVYGSGRELGFDYLRDGQRLRAIDRVQRGLDLAIIDEVDSLLLDEALTPLVLGGAGSHDGTPRFHAAMEAVERLRPEIDFDVEESARGARRTLTEAGALRVEGLLRDSGALVDGALHDPENRDLARVVHQCLRALGMHRDRDYLVTPEGEVLPLDRQTGRALAGRRWGDGLHQAVEAKERAPVRPEHQARAICSFERFLRSYASVSGMTGTARGVERELEEVHGLRVFRIPPHRPSVREDEPDRVFLTERAKLAAFVEEIERCHRSGSPVLVGVPSEEKALLVSRALHARDVEHRLLTAKHHATEAAIVAEAGRARAVTIATQVAGRGTDIVLGGDEVRALGGLRVLGYERHLRRRIDDQLRGRAGRGGDPGSSRFFVSLEDDLLARHADPSVRRWLSAVGALSDDIEAKVRAHADDAQERVELGDADRRVTGRKLDEVFEEQRRTVAEMRARLLSGRFPDAFERRSGGEDEVERALRQAVRMPIERLVGAHLETGSASSGERGPLRPRMLANETYRLFGCEVDLEEHAGSIEDVKEHLVLTVAGALTTQWRNLTRVALRAVEAVARDGAEDTTEAFIERVRRTFGISMTRLSPDASLEECATRARARVLSEIRRRARLERPRRVLRYFRLVYLDELDRAWTEHVAALTSLRDDLAIRFYSRGDPIVTYKREGYDAFRSMIDAVDRAGIARLLAAPALDRAVLDALETELRSARIRPEPAAEA
jgi:preprotein translocase subunit SecA